MSSMALSFTHRTKSKYGNSRFEKDGLLFASKLEYSRYLFLREAEECGEIENLRTQVMYELIPKQTETVVKHMKTKDKMVERCVFRPCTYIADFVYERNGNVIVEDTKGFPDQKFPIKQKLMYFVHHLYVKTIKKATTPLD